MTPALFLLFVFIVCKSFTAKIEKNLLRGCTQNCKLSVVSKNLSWIGEQGFRDVCNPTLNQSPFVYNLKPIRGEKILGFRGRERDWWYSLFQKKLILSQATSPTHQLKLTNRSLREVLCPVICMSISSSRAFIVNWLPLSLNITTNIFTNWGKIVPLKRTWPVELVTCIFKSANIYNHYMFYK